MQIKTSMRYYLTPPAGELCSKRQTITKVDKDVEKLEPCYSAGEDVKWWGYFRKQSGSFLQVYTQAQYDPAILLLGIYIQENWKLRTQKLVHECSLPKNRNNPNVHHLYIHTKDYYAAIKRMKCYFYIVEILETG